MNKKNEGLTVGELTIAIGALIIVSFIWSSFNSNQTKKETVTNSIYLNENLVLTDNT